MKALKLAHGDGHTDLCYDSSGSFILTGGNDGKVCIWEGEDDSDTTSVSLGERIFSISFQGGRFFTASEENTVRIFTFPDGVGDGMVTRFTAPVRHIDISADGEMMVAGADDFKIKVITMDDGEMACIFSEHEAPILSVALDPTREFVASASCDGTVKVWSALDGTVEKTMNLLTKCSEPSQAKSLCRMGWSEDGEFLFVPVESEVQIYSRSSWEVIGKLSLDTITDTYSVLAMCPDGNHLAVGCMKGNLLVYNWQDKKLVEKLSHPKHLTITGVAWNPKNHQRLGFCDNMGQLGFAEVSCVSQGETDMMADHDDDMLMASGADGGDDIMGDDIDRVLDDPDGENSIDIGELKRRYADEDDDAESTVSSKAAEPAPPVPVAAPVLPANLFKPTPLQPPFQPGSTPEHLSSRFMVWNTVGIVRQYTSEEENSIDVEFHNTATHHAIHVDNTCDYVMADLSSQALVLASRGDEDTPSKLLCMHFGSWDNCKEWTYDMPQGEEIQAVTVTDSLLVVATASRTLRIFSVGGLQREVLSLPGKPVSLASHSRTLMVVYHKGMGMPGDQFMGVSVIKVCKGSKVVVKDETLPLSQGSRLAWLGFSDEGTPFYMDYDGVVRILNRNFGCSWWPVANMKKHAVGKSDHYWLVSMNERQQQIRCIPCKGSRYPATLPRPALAVIPLQLPFLEMDVEKSQFEEAYQRNRLVGDNLIAAVPGDVNVEEILKPVRQALVKLFAFSAKGEREFRAIECCGLMEDQSLLQIAATYAQRLKRIQLAERIGGIMQRRQETETLEEEEEDEEEEVEVDQEEVSGQPELRGSVENEDDQENDEDEEDDSQKPCTPGPMLKTFIDKDSKSKDRPPRTGNPFKVARSADRSQGSATKGSQIFDNMAKSTPKAAPVLAPLPVSIKKNGKKSTPTGQPKLNMFKKDSVKSKPEVKTDVLSQYEMEKPQENEPVKKKLSALDLWLEEHRGDLQEEHPDLGEEDLGQKAIEAFRGLDKEERQKWVQKAKAQSEVTGMKRKADSQAHNGGDHGESKKMKSDTTNDSSTDKKTPLAARINSKLSKFAMD